MVLKGRYFRQRRLGAELFQHQLLNRIIEESPTGADAGLAEVPGLQAIPIEEQAL